MIERVWETVAAVFIVLVFSLSGLFMVYLIVQIARLLWWLVAG